MIDIIPIEIEEDLNKLLGLGEWKHTRHETKNDIEAAIDISQKLKPLDVTFDEACDFARTKEKRRCPNDRY